MGIEMEHHIVMKKLRPTGLTPFTHIYTDVDVISVNDNTRGIYEKFGMNHEGCLWTTDFGILHTDEHYEWCMIDISPDISKCILSKANDYAINLNTNIFNLVCNYDIKCDGNFAHTIYYKFDFCCDDALVEYLSHGNRLCIGKIMNGGRSIKLINIDLVESISHMFK